MGHLNKMGFFFSLSLTVPIRLFVQTVLSALHFTSKKQLQLLKGREQQHSRDEICFTIASLTRHSRLGINVQLRIRIRIRRITYAAVLVERLSVVLRGVDQTCMQSKGAGVTTFAPVNFKSDAWHHFGSSRVRKCGRWQKDGKHYADAAGVVPY